MLLKFQGTEKFRSEEERAKAIESIPDVSDPSVLQDIPSGVTLDDYFNDVERVTNRLLEAEIDEEAGVTYDFLIGNKEEQAAPNQTVPEQGVQTPSPQTPETTQTPAVSDYDKSLIEQRLTKAQEKYEAELKAREEELEKVKSEYEQKLADLKPAEEEKPDFDPNVERDLKDKISKAKEVARKISSSDDPFSEDTQKLVIESAALNAEIADLSYAKTNSIHQMAAEKIKKAQEAAASIQQSIEAQREAAEKSAKEKAAIEAIKKESEERYKIMDSFKTNVENFKNTRPYADMERDYVNFTAKVAGVYFDELPENTSMEQREIAFAKFQKGVPALTERLQASGIKAPEDINTFAELSEVGALYRGDEFNPETGEWSKLTNAQGIQIGFPDVKSAYDYYLKKTGKSQKTIVDAQREAVAQYQQATNTRTNPTELTSAYQQQGIEDMPIERAQKIMEDEDSYSVDEMLAIARAGDLATDAQKLVLGEYNKALKTMGLPELN